MTIKQLNGCMCQEWDCDSCNRLSEAWAAMRQALDHAIGPLEMVTPLLATEARAALRLADALADKAVKP